MSSNLEKIKMNQFFILFAAWFLVFGLGACSPKNHSENRTGEQNIASNDILGEESPTTSSQGNELFSVASNSSQMMDLAAGSGPSQVKMDVFLRLAYLHHEVAAICPITKNSTRDTIKACFETHKAELQPLFDLGKSVFENCRDSLKSNTLSPQCQDALDAVDKEIPDDVKEEVKKKIEERIEKMKERMAKMKTCLEKAGVKLDSTGKPMTKPTPEQMQEVRACMKNP